MSYKFKFLTSYALLFLGCAVVSTNLSATDDKKSQEAIYLDQVGASTGKGYRPEVKPEEKMPRDKFRETQELLKNALPDNTRAPSATHSPAPKPAPKPAPSPNPAPVAAPAPSPNPAPFAAPAPQVAAAAPFVYKCPEVFTSADIAVLNKAIRESKADKDYYFHETPILLGGTPWIFRVEEYETKKVSSKLLGKTFYRKFIFELEAGQDKKYPSYTNKWIYIFSEPLKETCTYALKADSMIEYKYGHLILGNPARPERLNGKDKMIK